MLSRMGVVEFELERTIDAPIDDVFARLADIDGHNEWMPSKGSILRSTKQTSSGAPSVGTTFVDDTAYGTTPGEIVGFEPPHRLVYHWWDKTGSGKLKIEGWPEYRLESADGGTTRVRHLAKLQTYGIYRFATPVLRRIALKERTCILDALETSFS